MFSHRYRYVFILLLAVYSLLNIIFTEGDRLFGYNLDPTILFFVLLSISFLVWEGNRVIETRIAKPFNIGKWKAHQLISLFFFSVVWAVITSLIVTSILNIIGLIPANNYELKLKLVLGFAFRINLFLNAINAIVFFMQQWRKSQLEAEQLKKETLEARLESLRSQINPHFLFNNLNVLSTLVYKDADTASQFINQLSKVYRYLLNHQEKKIVQLKDELDFIESYLYLLEIRFGNNLKVNIDLEEKHLNKYLPPATIQLIIENAIKHNVVSMRNPLFIEISANGSQHLKISNNLQEKKVKEPSTSVGLKNISTRYEFISSDKVMIEKNENRFLVKLPLIELSDI